MKREDERLLRSRVLRAGGWTTLGLGIGHAIRFGGNLVMTRLLVPDAFGIMAVAWTVIIGLWMVSDAGIRQCIVQSRNGDAPAFLDTAWSVQILRGAILTVAALAVAGALAMAQRLGLAAGDSTYSHPLLP